LKHFRPAGINELRNTIRGTRLSEPHFLVSFDDGLREVHDIAAPLLREHGLTAIVFINPAFVGNHDMMQRLKESATREKGEHGQPPGDWNEYLKAHRPYMDLDQLTSLQRDGFIIGAHSLDHPFYPELSLNELAQQTSRGIDYVQQHFHPELTLFAFPFTDIGVRKAFFDWLRSARVADASFGASGIKDDSVHNNFQRVPMEDYRGSASSIIRFEFALATFRKALGRNTIRRS
jgi:peptidoglycan/xylan/chitin deacetylase (PgdA/CDA1 family)